MKSTKERNSQTPEEAVAEQIHKHEMHVDAGVTAAGSVSGATIGALLGSIAGPPGAIAGAVMGAAVGGATGLAMERDHHRESKHDRQLDDDIGVTSEDLGARPVKNVPIEEEAAFPKL